jgi:exosortase
MNGIPKQPVPARSFRAEFTDCWQRLPNKALFFGLLAAWLALFQFLGNATFGYIDTASLLRWMALAYWNPTDVSPNHGWSIGYIMNGFTDDGHGFLIPVVVVVLLWWKRDELLSLGNRLWWPGMILLAVALVMHLVGYLVQQPRVSIVALFAGIYALTGLVWGPAWLRATFFPFILFAFCIPVTSIGEPITFPLRNFVAKIVSIICNDILGMSVIREGTQIFNSAHTYRYEVAAACSGLRSLIAILALATIYGFMTFETGWKRFMVVLSAFPLAVVGNVLRLLCIIIAAEMSGQAAGNYVHESAIFSLLPYVPAVIGMMLLGRWLKGRPIDPVLPLETKPV